MLRISNDNISNIDISGRGGAEQKIFPLFENNLERVNDPLYDAVDSESGARYEFKKQKSLQWFDAGKYHNLTPEQRNIVMTFFNYDDKGIDMIVEQDLGSFVDTCCQDPDFQKDGWTLDNIRDGAQKKIEHPKMQYKVPLKTRQYFKKYADRVKVIYSRKK